MRSARDILMMVQFYYHRISSERLSVEALMYDTYGMDLHIDYNLEDRVETYPDPKSNETILINKIMNLDTKIDKARETINHYVSIVDWIENWCKQTLTEQELIVIQLSYFGKQLLDRRQVAKKLKYSEAWVTKIRTSAYHKLDNSLVDLRQCHKLPEELDDYIGG